MKVGFLVLILCVISFFVGRGTSFMGSALSTNTLLHDNPMMKSKDKKLSKLDNGALVSKETFDYWKLPQESSKRGSYDKLTTLNLGRGLYTIGSDSIVNSHFIIGNDGVIVYDTADNEHDASIFYKELRKVTKYPVRAIIYSHEHYSLGARYFVEEEKRRGNRNIKIIGHPNTNKVMAMTGGVEALHSEVSGVLMARTVEQFNLYLPDKGDDARFKNTVIPNNDGFVPVNTPVRNGQRLTIAGVDMTFYTKDIGTDTSNQVLVHIPSKKAVLNNIMWGWFPNIYSLRGGKYRNPEDWKRSVEFIKKLKPEILMSTHSTSLRGREKIAQRLQSYQDGLSFVLDQTLKGISLGMGPDELRYFVKIPDYLKSEPTLIENYGTISSMPPRIYTAIFGHFDRDATNLYKLHPDDEAKRIVLAMGGETRVKSLADYAYRDGDYQWSCQLANYLVRINNSNDNNQIKANCLKQIGYRSLATTARSWALSQARKAEGKVAIIKNAPATFVQVRNNASAFVNNYRIRINPGRSQGTDKFIAVNLGYDEKYGLHIRNAVVDFVTDRKIIEKMKDIEVHMNKDTFTKIYNNLGTIDDFIVSADIGIEKGTREEVIEAFSNFDIIYDWENDPALNVLKERTLASEEE
ncbi:MULTISPECIES: alkyl sulfatase dimerization domain-containing protein [unclassified Halobacteriovorax]|uniref:alkyl sulfatase dimerization domain-containing protein n=1 Tax=unclassified Halobacteriovorax TaxID=2639665 RepID=UPI003999D68C